MEQMWVWLALAAILWAGAVAIAARAVEFANPPIGKFIDVNGLKLHYIERGQGPAVVLIHGNVTMLQDFLLSGVMELLATRYRLIVFDRPGFGYSPRPRDRVWTPEAQAAVLALAFERLGTGPAIVVGHSWGTLVALALAERHRALVSGIVLVSGFYYPRFRFDVLLAAPAAMPVLGDILRYTISPVAGLLFLPLMLRAMFGPPPIPLRVTYDFPKLMMLRPGQIRAASEDGAIMIKSAAALAPTYSELRIPAIIVAGTDDRIVKPEQSSSLFDDLAASRLDLVPGGGHMVHHFAPEHIATAVDEAAVLGGVMALKS